jgi:hypothetical protein
VAAFEGLKNGDPEDNGFKEPRVLEKKNDAPQVLKSDGCPPQKLLVRKTIS